MQLFGKPKAGSVRRLGGQRMKPGGQLGVLEHIGLHGDLRGRVGMKGGGEDFVGLGFALGGIRGRKQFLRFMVMLLKVFWPNPRKHGAGRR